MYKYDIATAVCLVLLIIELVGVAVSILVKKRPERIAFLRSFKKGKCAIIYFIAIPLYCMGHLYAGQGFMKAFFGAVKRSISLVVLGYETDSIDALLNSSRIYSFAVYFCFIMVGLNAIIFAISLTNQRIWGHFVRRRAFRVNRNKCFIFGNNDSNIAIYKSDEKYRRIIIDDMDAASCEKLYLANIPYISSAAFGSIVEKVYNSALKNENQCVAVINTGDEDTNMEICRLFIELIRSASPEEQEKLFLKLRIYVFGNPEYEAIYNSIESEGFGCINYVNKYRKIAIDFIDRYPFTKFMDERQIDYSTSLIRDGVGINAIFVGFGKTGRQVFLTSVANNQFITSGQNGPEMKAVRYHIFDKADVGSDKNLNHDYYRYKNECADIDGSEYLPLPSLPAEEHFYRMDINDSRFYNQLHSIVTANPNDANFIVISYGSDLENIDMAGKLLKKRKEWNVGNLTVFVRVVSGHKEQMPTEKDNCYFIGNDKDAIYNLDKILGDKITAMAKFRNEIYDLEYNITHNAGLTINDEYIKKNSYSANRKWHIGMTPMERESNLYCCLSIRSKLNLMGLDYSETAKAADEALTADEYMEIYAGNDRPTFGKYDATANGKPIISYSIDFRDSRRRNMAIQEHQRWNSFMISMGTIPSSKDEILNEKVVGANGIERYTNGKNYSVRRHGNLTTLDGLVMFRKLIAERDGKPETETDVIKYDYQLLDDAYWLLTEAGYKIVRK